MRILHISSARHFGGGERHLADLARGLSARGHEVFIAVRPTNQWESRLDFIPAENFLRVSIRNSFGMFSANRIGRFITSNSIDIVHAHVAKDYLPASVASRIGRGSRFVLTRHVMFPMKPFYKYALKNLDAAIAVSEGVAGQLRRVIDDEKVSVIHNGLDVQPLADAGKIAAEFRALHSIPSGVPLIGTLGELKPLKGQRDLVLAAQEIIKKVPDAHFLVVGVDNSPGKGFRRELKRMTSVLGFADRFTWLDWMEDTRPAHAAMDLFVSPSHSESFGLAILEAMAIGKPVIASRTEGAQTLIDDRSLLFHIQDPLSLARTAVALLDDRERMITAGGYLRARAAEMFSLTRFVDAHEDLYQKVLAAGR